MSAPTRRGLVAGAARRLAEAGVPDPVREARLLMRFAAGLDGAGLAARLGEASDAAEAARFGVAVAARAARRPLAQITGRREFRGRSFRVTPDVLDPRPETETLVALALEAPVARVLDLGTGTGCLLLTLLAERPGATGLGTDVDAAALAVAAGNAAALRLAGRAAFRRADWLDGIDGRFDLVVSNPPYIAEAEMAGLAPELTHEPRAALTPGGDGLGAYRRIAAGLAAVLAPGGRAILEIGPTQAAAVAAILAGAGLACEPPCPDLDGRPRAIRARLR